jgi:hypothetical protein
MKNEIPKVYFTKIISPERIVEIYKKLGITLEGKVAIKIHSGEDGNKNFLGPDMMKNIVNELSGQIVETNTAYNGARNTTEKHKALLIKHKWDPDYKVDILDSEGIDTIEIPYGKQIKKNLVGSHLKNYNSILVISHFKGHGMGGFGGALKQLSIGMASNSGKANIHSAGKTTDVNEWFKYLPTQDAFLESMADAASSIVKKYEGRIAFINVMKNLSVDCDCNGRAKLPVMKDIGILASLDPVAIDTACIDLVINSDDPGKVSFLERVNSLHGTHTIDVAEEHQIGSKLYQLINIDK